jgi:hypothetical protein
MYDVLRAFASTRADEEIGLLRPMCQVQAQVKVQAKVGSSIGHYFGAFYPMQGSRLQQLGSTTKVHVSIVHMTGMTALRKAQFATISVS